MLSVKTFERITKARYNKPPYNDNYEKEQEKIYHAYLNQKAEEKKATVIRHNKQKGK